MDRTMQELRHIGSIKDLRPQNKNNKKWNIAVTKYVLTSS